MNNKWVKIIIAMTLVLLLTFAAVACANDEKENDQGEQSNTSDTVDSGSESIPDDSDPVKDKVGDEGANTDDSWDEVLPM